MNYYNKYVKYKYKYLELIGGMSELEQIISDLNYDTVNDIEMISFFVDLIKQNILLDSNEPILTKELTRDDEHIKHIGKLKTTSEEKLKEHIIDITKNTEYIIEKNGRTYKFHPESIDLKCFFFKCNKIPNRKGIICIYSINDTLLIGFNVINDGTCEVVPELDIDKFIHFINILNSLLLDNINNIILFGHSYGMSQAIVTAYILLIITGRLKSFNTNNFNQAIISLNIDKKILDKIRRLIIKVIGSGGAPILFTKEEEFIQFYKALNKHYIHFVSKLNDTYDNHTFNLKCHYKSIKDGDNISDSESESDSESDDDNKITYINYLMCELCDLYTQDKKQTYTRTFINMNNNSSRIHTVKQNIIHDIKEYLERIQKIYFQT